MCILWSHKRAPTLKGVHTPYFWLNFLYKVHVYSNECPPWSEFYLANEAYLWSLRSALQWEEWKFVLYFIKGYYRVALHRQM